MSISIGILTDDKTLAEWLERGDVRGQYVLGCQAYLAQDYDRAFDLWSIAAEGGLAEAQFKIGWLYKQGKGVTRSFARAEHYYRLAAGQGFGEAHSAIAELGPSSELTSLENVGVRAYDPTTGVHDKIVRTKPE